MATHFRLFDPSRQFFDDQSRAVLAGGKIWTYAAGTTTAKTTFKDVDGVTNHTNPIILDASGRIPGGECFGTTGDYKYRLLDANDVELDFPDDMSGVNDVASVSPSEWDTTGGAPTYVSGTSFSLEGDQTSIHHRDRRLRITDSGGVSYASVVSSSYSDPLTTVTVVNDVSVIDSGLSAVDVGVTSAVNSSVRSFSSTMHVRATLSSAASAGGDNVSTIVPLDTDSTDLGGDFDTGNNWALIPEDGLYLLQGRILWGDQTVADGSHTFAQIYLDTGSGFNELERSPGVKQGGTTTAPSSVVVGTHQLSEGDKIALYGTVQNWSSSTGDYEPGCFLVVIRIA